MNNKTTFWGAILVLIGTLFLLRELFPALDLERFFWPILLIAGGILLIFRDKLKQL
jgi:hypothetical protein